MVEINMNLLKNVYDDCDHSNSIPSTYYFFCKIVHIKYLIYIISNTNILIVIIKASIDFSAATQQ